MVVLSEIIKMIEELAPQTDALSWDNIGLIVGDPQKEVNVVLLALDCTESAVKRADEVNADLIVTHHPLIFKPINRITTHTGIGRRLISLIKSDIALYAAHTNLDHAHGGTNDALITALGYDNVSRVTSVTCDNIPFCRAVELDEYVTAEELALRISRKLKSGGVSFTREKDRIVRKIAVCGGAAARKDYMDAVIEAGCDAYLTGDVGYHDGCYAVDAGLTLISAPHFATEKPVIDALSSYLKNRLNQSGHTVNVYIHETQSDVFSYMNGGQSDD